MANAVKADLSSFNPEKLAELMMSGKSKPGVRISLEGFNVSTIGNEVIKSPRILASYILRINAHHSLSKEDKLAALDALYSSSVAYFNGDCLALYCETLARLYDNYRSRLAEMFEMLSPRLLKLARRLSPGSMSKIAWAFAKANVENEQLFSIFASKTIRRKNEFSVLQLTCMAWAFAALNIEHDELFGTIAEELLAKRKHFDANTLSTAAWAFGNQPFDKYSELYANIGQQLLNVPVDEFCPKHIVQLHHVSLLGRLQLPPAIALKVSEILEGRSHRTGTVSSWESQVEVELRRLGLEPEPQVFVEGLRLDFMVRSKELNLAIECDGSAFHHVGGDPDGRPLGRQLIKDAILEKLSYKVVRIVGEKWRQQGHRSAMLAQLLDKAVGNRSWQPSPPVRAWRSLKRLCYYYHSE